MEKKAKGEIKRKWEFSLLFLYRDYTISLKLWRRKTFPMQLCRRVERVWGTALSTLEKGYFFTGSLFGVTFYIYGPPRL